MSIWSIRLIIKPINQTLRHENSCKHSKRAWGTPSKLYTLNLIPLCLTVRLLEEPQSTILYCAHTIGYTMTTQFLYFLQYTCYSTVQILLKWYNFSSFMRHCFHVAKIYLFSSFVNGVTEKHVESTVIVDYC